MVPAPEPCSSVWRMSSFGVNEAVIVFALVIVTLHCLAPVQAPDQPIKCWCSVGLSVSVTSMPC
jgi:hypothetical protein